LLNARRVASGEPPGFPPSPAAIGQPQVTQSEDWYKPGFHGDFAPDGANSGQNPGVAASYGGVSRVKGVGWGPGPMPAS
jgi:hypothetical protein